MPKAIVWDCDGVLVDSERINNEVFAALVTRAGVPTTPAQSVARYMGRSLRSASPTSSGGSAGRSPSTWRRNTTGRSGSGTAATWRRCPARGTCSTGSASAARRSASPPAAPRRRSPTGSP